MMLSFYFIIFNSFRLNRIISLEKELHEAKNQIDKLNKKYLDQTRRIEKVKSRYSTLRVKEKQRQKNEKKSGLNVR